MDATFLSFALAPMIAELHITGAQGGIIAAMSNWGALLGSVLFGILADRIWSCARLVIYRDVSDICDMLF